MVHLSIADTRIAFLIGRQKVRATFAVRSFGPGQVILRSNGDGVDVPVEKFKTQFLTMQTDVFADVVGTHAGVEFGLVGTSNQFKIFGEQIGVGPNEQTWESDDKKRSLFIVCSNRGPSPIVLPRITDEAGATTTAYDVQPGTALMACFLQEFSLKTPGGVTTCHLEIFETAN